MFFLSLSHVPDNFKTWRVEHKPITTLRRLLTFVKDKDRPEDRQGTVYKKWWSQQSLCWTPSTTQTSNRQGRNVLRIVPRTYSRKLVWCFIRTNAAESKLSVIGTLQTTYWRMQAKLTTVEWLDKPKIWLTITTVINVTKDGSKRTTSIWSLHNQWHHGLTDRQPIRTRVQALTNLIPSTEVN